MAIPPYHLSAPAVAIIDQNGVMTLSFTPSSQYSTSGLLPADPTVPQSFADYDHWIVKTTINALPQRDYTFQAPLGYSGGSLNFSLTLTSGTITLIIAACNRSSLQLTNFS